MRNFVIVTLVASVQVSGKYSQSRAATMAENLVKAREAYFIAMDRDHAAPIYAHSSEEEDHEQNSFDNNNTKDIYYDAMDHDHDHYAPIYAHSSYDDHEGNAAGYTASPVYRQAAPVQQGQPRVIYRQAAPVQQGQPQVIYRYPVLPQAVATPQPIYVYAAPVRKPSPAPAQKGSPIPVYAAPRLEAQADPGYYTWAAPVAGKPAGYVWAAPLQGTTPGTKAPDQTFLDPTMTQHTEAQLGALPAEGQKSKTPFKRVTSAFKAFAELGHTWIPRVGTAMKGIDKGLTKAGEALKKVDEAVKTMGPFGIPMLKGTELQKWISNLHVPEIPKPFVDKVMKGVAYGTIAADFMRGSLPSPKDAAALLRTMVKKEFLYVADVMESAGSAFRIGYKMMQPSDGKLHSCWKRTGFRGLGRPRKTCQDGEEQQGPICYNPCPQGTGIGPICWGSCPTGTSPCGALLCIKDDNTEGPARDEQWVLGHKEEDKSCTSFLLAVTVDVAMGGVNTFGGNWLGAISSAMSLADDLYYPICSTMNDINPSLWEDDEIWDREESYWNVDHPDHPNHHYHHDYDESRFLQDDDDDEEDEQEHHPMQHDHHQHHDEREHLVRDDHHRKSYIHDFMPNQKHYYDHHYLQ